MVCVGAYSGNLLPCMYLTEMEVVISAGNINTKDELTPPSNPSLCLQAVWMDNRREAVLNILAPQPCL